MLGKICHIKARSKGGPRYDSNQTDEERHSYENLILMCATHADVIDADVKAYTVEYLHDLKANHEQSAVRLSDKEAERGADLFLMANPVFSTHQSGGITAQTVHVHNYSRGQPLSDDATSRGFVAAKNGKARFRAPGEPLGTFWNSVPLIEYPEYDVFLADGPSMWLQVRPEDITSKEWTHEELYRCGLSHSILLQPLMWSNLQYLRSEDGFGTYATTNNFIREAETASVAFAFNTGEVWCTDTSVLRISAGKNLYFLDIARTLLQRFRGYGDFLKCLGIKPPYHWVVGLEGVKSFRLRTPQPPNHASTSAGEACLGDLVRAEGTFDPERPAATTLLPFFRELYKKCGMKMPEHVEELLRSNKTF